MCGTLNECAGRKKGQADSLSFFGVGNYLPLPIPWPKPPNPPIALPPKEWIGPLKDLDPKTGERPRLPKVLPGIVKVLPVPDWNVLWDPSAGPVFLNP